jgi:hypothetical protein
MAAPCGSDAGRYSWLDIEPCGHSRQTGLCVSGSPVAPVCGRLLLARLSQVLQKAVIEYGLLGCEGSQESCSGSEDYFSVEAGWLAGAKDMGTPTHSYGLSSEKN